jgi:hypothetical protein
VKREIAGERVLENQLDDGACLSPVGERSGLAHGGFETVG